MVVARSGSSGAGERAPGGRSDDESAAAPDRGPRGRGDRLPVVDRQVRDAISDEMLDRLARSPELATVRHRVQVTSFGGSGTTALCEHLAAAGADLPSTPGQFPFKHQRVPPSASAVPAGFRVVYPYADPRNAVVSLFRREYQGGHYRGMRLRRPEPDVEQCLVDLDHFLAGGVDVFGMADHFTRWYERPDRGYPVLFVRYEALPDVWAALRDFTGLAPDRACLPVRPRASEWQALPPAARDRLDEMFGELAGRLAALAPAELH